MKIELNPTIARYIEAGNIRDEETFLDCFATDAEVIDESQTRRGHEQIRQWFRQTREEYDFQSTPIRCTREGDGFVLVCTVAGNFPGSPVDLSYRFVLASDKIAQLKIV